MMKFRKQNWTANTFAMKKELRHTTQLALSNSTADEPHM
jgi:hypothetical protein